MGVIDALTLNIDSVEKIENVTCYRVTTDENMGEYIDLVYIPEDTVFAVDEAGSSFDDDDTIHALLNLIMVLKG